MENKKLLDKSLNYSKNSVSLTNCNDDISSVNNQKNPLSSPDIRERRTYINIDAPMYHLKENKDKIYSCNQYNNQQIYAINDFNNDTGTYRPLHDNEMEKQSDCQNCNPCKRSKGLPFKMGIIFLILFTLFLFYLPVYNQVDTRHECHVNCSFSLSKLNGDNISSLYTHSSINSLHVNSTPFHRIHRIFFEKFWFASKQGTVAGWSYNTSRNTRNYVLPDNVTLLNDPKAVCKTNKNTHIFNKTDNSKIVFKSNNSSKVFLLVIICSKIENFHSRSAIRETWANQKNYEKLSFIFQNISRYYQNINVTDKLLNDLNDFANISNIDKRTKRDITKIMNNSFDMYEDVTIESFNDSFSGIKLFHLKEDNHLENNAKFNNMNSNNYTNNNHLVKREINNNMDNMISEIANIDISDDPRFDHGTENSFTSQIDADDNKILGNFEENFVEKNGNIEYYDYQSEPSNIMRIPPRGEKIFSDNQIKEANNLIKINVRNDKLNLEFQLSSTMTVVDQKKIDTTNLNNDKIDSEKSTLNSDKFEPPVQVKFLFLLGQSNDNNTDLQSKIDEEAAIYGDIIQEGFIDSYNNLTLKSIMLLKWVVTNCVNDVHYIMKTDDDMYVNIPRLIEALKNKTKEHILKTFPIIKNENKTFNDFYDNISDLQKTTLLQNEKLLMGDLICDARPITDINSKWYSPTYMFGEKVYPRYLSGTGYIMSFTTAELLYKAALDMPLFHLEDIFITGMCSKKAGIKPIDHPGFSYMVRKFDPCIYAYLITAHQMTPVSIRRIHKILTNPSTKLLENCEIRRIISTKNTSFLTNIKNIFSKLNTTILGSPKSFINGLIGLGIVDNKSAKSGTVTKKRKKPNNGCF